MPVRTSQFASALLTGGVGPWLPFQMLASAWIGLGVGLLPRRVTGLAEIVLHGPALLATFRRASRRATFGATPTYASGR